MRTKLPTWAWVIIAFTSIVLVGVLALEICSTFALDRLVSNANKPDHIKIVAKDIAEFPDPLPDGYSYQMGVSFPFVVSMINIDHKSDKQLIEILSYGLVSDQDPKDFPLR